jgi:hypothetical protein
MDLIMPTTGVDCQVILDGVGYFVEPHTYAMKRARLRKASVTKGGDERYVDLGPGKREWHMILLCLNQLVDYSGQALPVTGQALRDALRASYEKTPATGVVTLPYIDLDGASYRVHFDDYEEQVRDPRTQLVGPSYHCAIVLVES